MTSLTDRALSAFELYGALILAMLAFVVPVIGGLLSLFPEGVKALATKYENERRQSEDNILSESKKRDAGQGLDYGALEETLRVLKAKRRQAELKLQYLHPTGVIRQAAIPFVLAFASLLVSIQGWPDIIVIPALLASLASFAFGTTSVFNTSKVLFEVSELVNENRRATESKIVALLSALVENTGSEKLFLKDGDITISLNDKRLKDGVVLTFSAGKKYELPFAIINSAHVMAKKVETGLRLPKGFLVEKTPNLRLYTDEDSQIVRFTQEVLHANTHFACGKVLLTFLEPGNYNTKAFINGENVRHCSHEFKIHVIA